MRRVDDEDLSGAEFRECDLSGSTSRSTRIGRPSRPCATSSARQTAEVAAWLADATPDLLRRSAPVPDDGRWPAYAEGRSVRQCLATVLDEEWAHHGFAARDLDLVQGRVRRIS